MKRLLVIFFITCFLFLSDSAGFCGSKANLYNMCRAKRVVKVYMPDIQNLSGSEKVDAVDLKQKLTAALKARKSINFEVVDKREASDITIDCAVTAFYWASSDPIDMIFGTAVLAYDLVTVQNYAYLEADFEVFDTKKGKAVWSERLKVDLTKENMDEGQSIPLINDRTVKVFIRDCFSKKYSKPRTMMMGR